MMPKKNQNEKILDLDATARIIEQQIQRLNQKIQTGRIRDHIKEEVRIKQTRTLGYMCNIYTNIKVAQEATIDENDKEVSIQFGTLGIDGENIFKTRRNFKKEFSISR